MLRAIFIPKLVDKGLPTDQNVEETLRPYVNDMVHQSTSEKNVGRYKGKLSRSSGADWMLIDPRGKRMIIFPTLQYSKTTTKQSRIRQHYWPVANIIGDGKLKGLDNLRRSHSCCKSNKRKIRVKAPQYKLIRGNLYRRSFFTPWLRCVASLPADDIIKELLSDRLKTILPNITEESIQQALPKFDQRIQETLRSTMPDLLNKPLNKELNALNTLEMGKAVKKTVWKEMDIVKNQIYYYGSKLDKGELHMEELIILMKDMVSLLDKTNVFEKVKAEGEKVSLAEDIELELAEKAKAKVVKEAKRGSPEVEEMFAKLELTIEARNDVTEAKKIIKDNLDGLGQHIIKGLVECKASASNLKHIQVKDIVKEVEDYLKTYSSAEMDINWYMEGIRCGFKESQSLMHSLCSGLRVLLSNKRRLVAELEALGESEGAAKCLEHMRVIFGRGCSYFGELDALCGTYA
ncbi:hypothetical protein Tco_0540959 [Tanacetum coccineum]